jgi:hypothetical protein
MRRLAFWLLFAPVPDPELRLELMGYAMVLLTIADLGDRWLTSGRAA